MSSLTSVLDSQVKTSDSDPVPITCASCPPRRSACPPAAATTRQQAISWSWRGLLPP
ncbi:hypothetical protein ZEAMMB73_Zm00001d005952 [Zea mays]|uniref:Uncharacterized protein n=1 Tax=Zea mays TaxID=4577 RepID=A0A1D6ERP1_MAIZE|nr:hypothetical protein ZEAMMB73_Zm00001d005952 [Zea mays]ONM22409.1 hypothetical protein ZEAMMB73_Zm00001d005952 [Zea mays]